MKRHLFGVSVLATLIAGAGQVRANYMIWTDSNGFGPGGDIRRAELDGTGQRTLVSGLGGPGGLAVDLAAGKMYWTDGDSDDIRRAGLDGAGQQVLVSQQVFP